MTTFYGSVYGSARQPATRRGSKKSGIRASAQSLNASIIVTANSKKDKTVFAIEAAQGSTCFGQPIISGTYDELVKLLKYAEAHKEEILNT